MTRSRTVGFLVAGHWIPRCTTLFEPRLFCLRCDLEATLAAPEDLPAAAENSD